MTPHCGATGPSGLAGPVALVRLAYSTDRRSPKSRRNAALRPNVVLIGTDVADVAIGAMLRRALEARGIAFELMNLGAACRTYNVLAQERREVVAGLFP